MAIKAIEQWAQTFGQKSFPEEMRRQLWPLCCGAAILSGFKKGVQVLTDDELVQQIEGTLKLLPDFQVYGGEQINPRLTFLTLNEGQMQSKKIMGAIEKAGFVKIMEASPRYAKQGFFIRDDSKTAKTFEIKHDGAEQPEVEHDED